MQCGVRPSLRPTQSSVQAPCHFAQVGLVAHPVTARHSPFTSSAEHVQSFIIELSATVTKRLTHARVPSLSAATDSCTVHMLPKQFTSIVSEVRLRRANARYSLKLQVPGNVKKTHGLSTSVPTLLPNATSHICVDARYQSLASRKCHKTHNNTKTMNLLLSAYFLRKLSRNR